MKSQLSERQHHDKVYVDGLESAWCTNSKGERVYQSGNDPNNPNGMKGYQYKGEIVYAYCRKDVPMRYKFIHGK